jgi:hypothetical protein
MEGDGALLDEPADVGGLSSTVAAGLMVDVDSITEGLATVEVSARVRDKFSSRSEPAPIYMCDDYD